ncbi:Uncharacterised protein [Mycobacteroides abscessus subsp. abscessus]|nr:Uncharacterised protein [Mycobacteroides abscessus subsp. abscessus]
MRPSECFCRALDVARSNARADVGRRVGHRVLAEQRDGLHLEPETLTELCELLDVARGLLPEGEIGSDHHFGGMQALDENVVREVFRRTRRQLGGERHHAEHVDPQLLGQLGSTSQRRQLWGMRSRPDNLGGVRVERHQHRRDAALGRRRGRGVDQLRVPPVDAVEHTDGDHTPAPIRGHLVQTSPSQHADKPTATDAGEPAPAPA